MKQLKIGIILNYVTILLTFTIGLIYTPFLIRSLGQEEYGIYALAFSIAGFLSLLDLGIGNSIVRFVSMNMVKGNKLEESKIIGFFLKLFSYIAVATIVLGFSIAFNIGSIVSNEFTESQVEDLKVMVFILTLNFAIGFVFTTFAAVIQAYERFIFLKILSITRTVLIPIISLVILFYSKSLILLTIVLLIVNTAVLVVHYIYYKRNLQIKLSFEGLNINYKKEIIAYSSVVFIVAIADKLYWQTDQVLLGILKSPNDVAIYAVAIQFINIFMSLSLAITSVFLPKITKLVNEGDSYGPQLNAMYIQISKFQTFIVGLAFSGFIIFGKDFIALWVGQGYELVYVITLILVSTFFLDLIQNLGLTIMQAKGKYKFRAYALIICAILNIIISIPIIKLYGSVGTAVVTAIFVLLGNVVILNIYFHKRLGLDMIDYWKEIGKFLMVISVITVASYYTIGTVHLDSWIKFFAAAITFFVIFTFFIFMLYLKKTEKQKVVQLVRSKFCK